MKKEELINEMLKVIFGVEVFDTNDWWINDDENCGLEIEELLTNWVNKYDVNDVEFTVSHEEFDNYLADCGYETEDFINNVTTKKINFVDYYDEMNDKKNEVLEKDYEGPGWDGVGRCDTRWNKDYFFTGSDCTFYILIKRI